MEPTVNDRLRAALALRLAEQAARREMRPKIEREGVEALHRLLPIAQSDTGQSRRVARFLLGLYNGHRFRFNFTDLRCLDYALHDDCMAILRMDHTPAKEIHRYLENGSALFEALARGWGLEDRET